MDYLKLDNEGLDSLIEKHQQKYTEWLGQNIPFFSVVIPTYERHAYLDQLMQFISRQTFKDFEVIIIDQSTQKWANLKDYTDLNLQYFHTDVKGAVKARNRAINIASGKVVAFTDDDCQPDANWLLNAFGYFIIPEVIGVEGRIDSSHYDDPNYRTVSNKGLEGYGFMTANLFIRREVLKMIGGFDERFDHPNFREDTDLGWRALEYGEIPFAEDVKVFHPPLPRSLERESVMERSRGFAHDPLLLQKHPQRYIELFLIETHYKNTEGFWEYFMEGLEQFGISEGLQTLLNEPRVEKQYFPQRLLDITGITVERNNIFIMDQSINVEEIMQQIRQKTAEVQQIENELPDFLQANRNTRNNSYFIQTEEVITSHRKVIGPLIILGKKVVRKLLRWYIAPPWEQQNYYNTCIAQSLNEVEQYFDDATKEKNNYIEIVLQQEKRIDVLTEQVQFLKKEIIVLARSIEIINGKKQEESEKEAGA